MKYSELERKLKKIGCYEIGEMNGHPLWYSPMTDKHFKMSNHKNKEVAKGTLKNIINNSILNSNL
jgi:predicted RNA binding protein YcfA (HicA-like mRNA interferase family)